MALFSIERFVVVLYPLKKYLIASKQKHKIAIFYTTLFPLVLYSFSLKTSGLEYTDNAISCVTLAKWFKFTNVFAFVDSFLTMFLPFFVILISNVAICVKLLRSSTGALSFLNIISKNSLAKQNSVCNNHVEMISFVNSEHHNMHVDITSRISQVFTRQLSIPTFAYQNSLPSRRGGIQVPRQSVVDNSLRKSGNDLKRSRAYYRTTRLLLIISSVFFLFNTPMYFSKLYYYLKNSKYEENTASVNIDLKDFKFNAKAYNLTISHESVSYINKLNFTVNFHLLDADINEEIMEIITCFLYYLHFSLNFFLYSFSGASFRRTFSKCLTSCLPFLWHKLRKIARAMCKCWK